MMIRITRNWLDDMSTLYHERSQIDSELKSSPFIYSGDAIKRAALERAETIDGILEEWYRERMNIPLDDREIIDAYILYTSPAMRAFSCSMSTRNYQRRVARILERYK